MSPDISVPLGSNCTPWPLAVSPRSCSHFQLRVIGSRIHFVLYSVKNWGLCFANLPELPFSSTKECNICIRKKKLSIGNSSEQPHRRHLKLWWGIRFSITKARLLTCPETDLLTCSEEYMTCQGLLASSLNVSPFSAQVFHLASEDVVVPMSVHLDC